MMKLKLLLFLMLFFFPGCQEKPPQWPTQIMNNIWIPKEAQGIHYNRIDGSYQVIFTVKERHPGNRFIQAMVTEMIKKGWRRLDFDFLNPKLKTNHNRIPFGLWDHFIDEKGKDIYQWIDDWEDSKKNIFRFFLKYRRKYKSAGEACTLEVVEIYIPMDLRGK